MPKVLVTLKDGQQVRRREIEFDFADLAVKGRGSLGNVVTKFKVQKVTKWRPIPGDPPKPVQTPLL